MGKRVLVTGGAGFIPSNLIRLLLEHTDHEVVYEDLVANEQAAFDELFRFLEVEPQQVSSSLQKVNPTAHEELIENYGEVREVLADTEFAPLLR